MKEQDQQRRKFLKQTTLLGGMVAGSVIAGRGQETGSAKETESEPDLLAYGRRSEFEDSVLRTGGRPGGGGSIYTPLQDTVGIITPSALHYVFSRDAKPPTIDPSRHRLMVHGMVERPLMLTMEELRRLPSVSRIHFVECVSNTNPTRGRHAFETVQERHGKTSCSEWTGVPLSLVLREAGLKPNASWLVAESADRVKHAMSIPLEKAMDDTLLAYGQNGEMIRPDQGYPLRLLVPGWEGVRNVKWLRRIKVGDRPFMTHTESSNNPSLRHDGKARWFNFEMGPKSVITVPSGGQQLTYKGFYEVTGLAWSGLGTIRRVEVSVDGGSNWQDAELQNPILPKAHVRFRFPWNWQGQEAMLLSRCTDDQGVRQPSLLEFADMWGVEPDYFRTTTNTVIHFNPIQPWRVTRDGQVQNAVWDV